ncbi:MAG: dihydrolipoyllysine-residue succinyltransferase [Vicinamibacteria bacterium]|nr:dihydrolipoyllysine-residue succinyltransferase [Vicinamibacteria bacterium]
MEIRVPALGESINEVVIGQWLRREGTVVAADEPVVSLESDKANVELPAPAAGRLVRLRVPAGATAKVGDVLAELDPVEAQVQAPPAVPSPTVIPAPPAPPASPAAPPPPAVPIPTAVPTPTASTTSAASPTPAVVRPPTPQPPRPTSGSERVVPMSTVRRRIAERLVEAQRTAAMLTTFNECDMSRVLALRREHQEAFTRKHGVKLGFLGFFVKAAVEALREVPELNAEIRGSDLVYHERYDVGVAVDTPRGLMVPVLRGADRLSLADLERGIAELAARARESKLGPDDLAGGTFTITNGGVFGSLLSTPILNPPQSGILGLHKIQERGVAVEGRLELRPMMYVALSYDHRIVDGRGAVTWLVRLKERIEDPARLLLGV